MKPYSEASNNITFQGLMREPNIAPEDIKIVSRETTHNPWMYYHKPDGWVVAGQANVEAVSDNLRSGWVPLPRYGHFYPARNPGQLFQHLLENGGAREFPDDQVLEFGWHRKPPLPSVTFPHLSEFKDKVCRRCDKRFVKAEHLEKHLGVVHRQQILSDFIDDLIHKEATT